MYTHIHKYMHIHTHIYDIHIYIPYSISNTCYLLAWVHCPIHFLYALIDSFFELLLEVLLTLLRQLHSCYPKVPIASHLKLVPGSFL